MKRVRVNDVTAGHAVGWNPDGALTAFTIIDTAVSNFDESFVDVIITDQALIPHPDLFCDAWFPFSGGFNMVCSSAPPDGAILSYVVTNLPANLVA